jgi:hypothetical protein
MKFDHAGHEHDTAEATLAHSAVQSLSDITGGAPVCAIVVGEAEDGLSVPYVSARGNVTDFAHMVESMLEMIVASPRPSDCIVCMTNYDRLVRARAALGEIVGRC